MIFLKNFSICYCNLRPLIFPPINLNFLIIQVDWRAFISVNHFALPAMGAKKAKIMPTGNSIKSYNLSAFKF